MLLDRLIEQNPQEPGEYAFGKPSPAKKPLFSKLYLIKLILSSQVILSSVLFPVLAQASFLSILGIGGDALPVQAITASATLNSQTLALPQAQAILALQNPDEDTDLTVADNALIAETGPLGTQADVVEDEPDAADIYTYVVRNGDTLPVVAKMLNVSVGTIVWANDLPSKNAKLTPGQVLTILPVSGISYTIKKNDTVSSIARAFKVDADEIGRFNGLESDSKLQSGATIIIPGAELALPTNTSTKTSGGTSGGTKTNSQLPLVAYGATRYLPGHDGPDLGGYFIRPTKGCTRTQGLHGADGVDIACPNGVDTPILAAASGTVLIAKSSGWNGGFGEYVVINHSNGSQTLYGHMSRVDVSPGQVVTQGQLIGLMGATGRATGKHLHWEVHGAMNPVGKDPRYGL